METNEARDDAGMRHIPLQLTCWLVVRRRLFNLLWVFTTEVAAKPFVIRADNKVKEHPRGDGFKVQIVLIGEKA